MSMENLMFLREEIDRIDEELIRIFERRIRVVEKIAEYKHSHALLIRDEGRRREKIYAVGNLVNNESDKKLVKKLYEYIISLSEEVQNSYFEKNNS